MLRSLSDLRATPPAGAEVEPQQDHAVESSEKEMRRMFDEWKVEYGREYGSPALEEERFRAFKETVREAEAHNAKVDRGEETEYRLNYSGPFSDYTSEELASFLRSRFGSESELASFLKEKKVQTLRHPYRVKEPLDNVHSW